MARAGLAAAAIIVALLCVLNPWLLVAVVVSGLMTAAVATAASRRSRPRRRRSGTRRALLTAAALMLGGVVILAVAVRPLHVGDPIPPPTFGAPPEPSADTALETTFTLDPSGRRWMVGELITIDLAAVLRSEAFAAAQLVEIFAEVAAATDPLSGRDRRRAEAEMLATLARAEASAGDDVAGLYRRYRALRTSSTPRLAERLMRGRLTADARAAHERAWQAALEAAHWRRATGSGPDLRFVREQQIQAPTTWWPPKQTLELPTALAELAATDVVRDRRDTAAGVLRAPHHTVTATYPLPSGTADILQAGTEEWTVDLERAADLRVQTLAPPLRNAFGARLAAVSVSATAWGLVTGIVGTTTAACQKRLLAWLARRLASIRIRLRQAA